MIGAGLLIVGLCILGMNLSLERRLNRGASATDEGGADRAEALRQISRDIAKGQGGGFS
jgi:hypothetical protein